MIKPEPFDMTFIVKDNAEFVRNAENYYCKVEAMMRDSGYVPVWDMEPLHHINYDDTKNEFEITVILYGQFVGDNAWNETPASLRLINQKYLQDSKLRQFSEE